MKKILLAILLIPSFAFATPIPPGCYVADSYRTDPCWGEFETFVSWSHSGNRFFEQDYYGNAIEILVYNAVQDKNLRTTCDAAFVACDGLLSAEKAARAKDVSDFNTLVADYNNLVNQNKLLQTKITKLNKQIKKLKGK